MTWSGTRAAATKEADARGRAGEASSSHRSLPRDRPASFANAGAACTCGVRARGSPFLLKTPSKPKSSRVARSASASWCRGRKSGGFSPSGAAAFERAEDGGAVEGQQQKKSTMTRSQPRRWRAVPTSCVVVAASVAARQLDADSHQHDLAVIDHQDASAV